MGATLTMPADLFSAVTGDVPSIADVQRYAAEALALSPRLGEGGGRVTLVEGSEAGHETFRARAIGDGTLVIQREEDGEPRPFAGLLVSRSHPGWPPRLLYDMGPLDEGSVHVPEACRMLQAFVRHASVA